MNGKVVKIIELFGELTEEETLEVAKEVYSQLSQEKQDEFFDWMESEDEEEEEE